ncbi:MAG TPA: DNA methyltransferase [Xanthomonadaceae bacterium]|nr:DNA methyltransferase [Xanthomonadaceae bacterium]
MTQAPGTVRDSIFSALAARPCGASVSEITQVIHESVGPVAPSSVRSYLRLNTPRFFVRSDRGVYRLRDDLFEQSSLSPYDEVEPPLRKRFAWSGAELLLADCFDWMREQPECSIETIVTDPPYGLIEFSEVEKAKLRRGKGGVWRIPPSFDGSKRSPLPRFTVLGKGDLMALHEFFKHWGRLALRMLVPGANVIVASNPLLSYLVSSALADAGMERRGEIVRLVMTMRGGDRPKAAHDEFPGVSVMPRSMWEPWLVFRKPLDGRVQDNLRRWKVGGFRRPAKDKPFGDVIESSPTRASERKLAPHPSLKPQAFMRKLVRASLPLGEGIVCDPFAGAGSTLAAACAVGYRSMGVEKDSDFYATACTAIPKLADLLVS